MELNTLHCIDYLDLLKALPDGSADAVIIDPPYGIQHDAWDDAIDIKALATEAYRVVKDKGFIAYFGQMPTLLDWLVEFRLSAWRFKDHISWIKRNSSNVATPLHRQHETIMIYSKGIADYHQTKGRYEDVKLPGVLVDIVTLAGIDRYIKDLRIKANGDIPAITGRGLSNPKYRFIKGQSDRSCEYANFTNVWSFLPESLSTRNIGSMQHPTTKPVALMVRLCELLSPKDGLVVDCFAGSGTTAIGAKSCGRNFICGDQSAEYIEIARQRVFPEFGKPVKRVKPELALSDLPLFASLKETVTTEHKF